jgi:hypothetical protein
VTTLTINPVQPQAARKSREVRIGDVSVTVLETPPRSVNVDIANDPRFHFTGNLLGVTAQISVNDLSLQRTRYEDLFSKTASNSSLYPVPESMSVVPSPAEQNGFVVRIDNVKFLGSTPFAFCRRSPDRRRIHNYCTLDAALTETVAVHLSFDDDRVPPDRWPEFLKNMEAGFHQIAAHCETSIFGERCRH